MPSQSESIAAIKQLAEDWRAGWLAGDVEALLALYADDPVLLPCGQPAVFGKEAIRAQHRPILRDYIFQSEQTLMEVEASGDLGYFWVTYRLTATPNAAGAPVQETGKALFIVKRERSAWKIARLIDNSDRVPTNDH
ncbi:MAG TPA: SgcJ/EcaC family oxidoreductase [Gallionella sp.]|nr:SgcJ/EcaC family oxidoreductase [Gallionella sp.]